MENFAKFRDAVCEILRNSAALLSPIPKYPTFCSIRLYVAELTDSTLKCKEFIVTCNMKTHYIRPLMMKIHVIIPGTHNCHKSKLTVTRFYCFIYMTRFYCFRNGKIKNEPEKP